MTIGTETLRNDIVAAGSTDFTFTFPIYSKSNILVLDNGTELTIEVDYTVRSGGGLFESLAESSLPSTGFIRISPAPTNGHIISLIPLQPIQQSSDYTLEPFPFARMEKDLDKNVMIGRMLREQLRRALKFAPESQLQDIKVPEPDAGKSIGWNNTEDGLINLAASPAGPPGADGSDGANGVSPVFRAAAGVPSDGLGINGDVYINVTNGDLYLKTGGTYSVIINIVGPAGAGSSPTIREVDGTPSISLPTAIEFLQSDGFIVTEPSAGIGRVSLSFATIGALLRDAATSADGRSALAAAGLAVENIFTKRQQWKEGAAVASATSITLLDDGNFFHITGSTEIETIANITGIGPVWLCFDGAPNIVHSASLILQDAIDFQAAAGDILQFIYEGSSVWREVGRHLASAPVAPATTELDPEVQAQHIWNDFIGTIIDGLTFTPSIGGYTWSANDGAPSTLTDFRGILRLLGNGGASPYMASDVLWLASDEPTVYLRWAQVATTAGTRRIGGSRQSDNPLMNSDPVDGIFFRHAAAGNIFAVCRAASVESTLDTGIAAANGVFHTGRLVITPTTVDVYIDGVLKGQITTNITTLNLFSSFGYGANTGGAGIDVDYFVVKRAR